MRSRRSARMPLIRGIANFERIQKRRTKVMASHKSWEAKVDASKGGNDLCSAGVSTSVPGPIGVGSPTASGIGVCVSAILVSPFAASGQPPAAETGCGLAEQENERDEQREDAERLGHREAEDQAAKLPVSGG